ncbi:carboxymuconolactone decarboxylase family protein [Devosia sp.]|uniref:carboxymuconolactone decarboxylase family protein n=1 Tax=Devosia sp. TaxID=1871048 RepID=UPI001B29D940|nr:carboxymuconolactone decarboxylase family protein [Devosia sp.]MBO9588553.1 carboxymuconolactone decarboxylase family protein [Devosia sp.]
MTPRMQNPAFAIANVGPALISLGQALGATRIGNIPLKLVLLTHIRTSQLNGCSYCVSFHSREARKAGETEDRLYAVAAWRHSSLFSAAEKAALELTEAVTVVGAGEMVSDDLWLEVGRHFAQEELAALLLEIATTNLWNRLNAATQQQFHIKAPAAA